MFIEIVRKNEDSRKEEPEVGEQEVEYFYVLLTRSELAYYEYLMCGPIPSIFLRNLIITEGCPSNLKIPCNIRHVHVDRDYTDLNSPLNVMTCMMYNWIMRRKLDPRENSNQRISNFTGRIKGTHVFIGNFTYITNFMIVEDISSIIDPRFTNRNDEVAYKMPHKIEQYNSLSNLEKEHMKLVYLRNKEDKRRGVEYVMSKILGFYKECLELGPEYLTGMDDEGKSRKDVILELYAIVEEGETGVQVGKGGRGRRPKKGNDERVDDLNGQGNDQRLGANGGVEGVNGNVKGANRGSPDFLTIIAQQLQNLPAMLAQVSNRGNFGNQNGNVVNENVQENVENVIVNGNRVGCSYKEFLACNPKEYDGKGGVVVLTRWIEKIEAGHPAYTDRFHELARLVPHLVTPESRITKMYMYGLAPQICGMVAATEPKTIQKVVQISGALTDEAVRNGSIKKVEKRGNV
ncbi:hypothetical protein Tco_1074237, partial [Tanacetum coccineum]